MLPSNPLATSCSTAATDSAMDCLATTGGVAFACEIFQREGTGGYQEGAVHTISVHVYEGRGYATSLWLLQCHHHNYRQHIITDTDVTQ